MKALTAVLIAILVLLAAASLHLGVRFTPPAEVWRALTAGGGDQTALIVNTLRLPRAMIAMIVGAALAIAGVLMQTVTRNPLAEPGLLGVNAGAAFAAVLVVTLTGEEALAPLMAAACAGALLTAAAVYGVALSGGGRAAPLHLLLAGIVVAALLASLTQILLISNERTMEELLFWLSGSFADRNPLFVLPAAGLVLAIGVGCLAAAPQLDILSADETTASALGLSVVRMRFAAIAGAALLSGFSVALAGPVPFVGLAAPHLVRRLGVRGHARLLPLAAIAGAALAMAADIVSRFIIYPSQAPVGAVMAMLGVPVLLMLLHRRAAGVGL